MINRYPPHPPRRKIEKMRSIPPIDALHRSRVGFFHQIRRLKAGTGALAAARTTNDAGQPLQLALISVAPAAARLADIAGSRLTRLRRPLHMLYLLNYTAAG